MDQQLKQRLIGVTIFFTLVIIFVPMLFEKSDDKGRLTSGEIPSIPDDVLEKPLELPKTAEDLAPKEEAEKAKAESGYHIVPFNEEPPKPKEDARAKNTEGEEPAIDEEGAPETDVKKAGQDGSPAASAKPKSRVAAPRQEIPADVDAEEEPAATPPAPVAKSASKPETAPKKAQSTHPAETAGREAETPTAAVRTEKARAKPAPSPVAAEEAQGSDSTKTPANAKPKPKVAAKPAEPPVKETAKKTEPPKPAPAVKTEKTEPAATAQPPAPPPKPSAKPVEPAKAKAPTSWVVQAGSFTDEAGAKALAEKLKQAKFPAYVEAVTGSHGQIYRVQVGPESELRKAQETLKQIGTSIGINGFIAPRH